MIGTHSCPGNAASPAVIDPAYSLQNMKYQYIYYYGTLSIVFRMYLQVTFCQEPVPLY